MAGKQKVKIGASIDLPEGATMVRLPDGTVVTARARYTVQHAGDHKVIDGPTFEGTED